MYTSNDCMSDTVIIKDRDGCYSDTGRDENIDDGSNTIVLVMVEIVFIAVVTVVVRVSEQFYVAIVVVVVMVVVSDIVTMFTLVMEVEIVVVAGWW